jgi:hypothetical protein
MTSNAIADTSNMVYNNSDKNIYFYHNGNLALRIDNGGKAPNVRTYLGGTTGTYITTNTYNNSVNAYVNSTNLFYLDQTTAQLRPSGTTELQANTSGVSLKSGTAVNNISTLLTIPGDDNTLLTEQAITEHTTVISGALQQQIDAKPNSDHQHTLVSLTDTPSGYDNGKYLQSTDSGVVWATTSGTAHTHYDVDMTYVADSTWLYSGDTFVSVPSDLQVFLNGVKNRANDSDYYNATVSGTDLVVIFAYPTSDADWANATYTK